MFVTRARYFIKQLVHFYYASNTSASNQWKLVPRFLDLQATAGTEWKYYSLLILSNNSDPQYKQYARRCRKYQQVKLATLKLDKRSTYAQCFALDSSRGKKYLLGCYTRFTTHTVLDEMEWSDRKVQIFGIYAMIKTSVLLHSPVFIILAYFTSWSDKFRELMEQTIKSTVSYTWKVH